MEEKWWNLCVERVKSNEGKLDVVNESLATEFLLDESICPLTAILINKPCKQI